MSYNISKRVIIRGAKLVNLLVNVFLFLIYFYFVNYHSHGFDLYLHIYIIFAVLYALSVFWLSQVYNGYMVGAVRVSELVYSLSLSTTISSFIMYVVMVSYLHKFRSITLLLAMCVMQVIWNIIWALVANRLYFAIHLPKKTAIVYRHKNDLNKLAEIQNFAMKFEVIKTVENPQEIHALIQQLEGCEVIFVAGINATLRNGIAKYCIEKGIQGYIEPKIGDVIMSGARHMQMFSIPLMRIRRVDCKPEYLFIKRVIDIVFSLVAIIITSPVMIATAVAIKCYDGGSALYKQVRLTKDGKEFKILKFRSMKVNAEDDGVARLASEHDNRITPIGRLIRAIRFDELPQLFNILFGDMTIVGPRPERPEIAKQYERVLPAFPLRLQVKAGLTGYAQVYGKYNTEPYDKLEMDLMYINHMSLAQDFWLMFATVKILFMKDSTAGIAMDQVTATKEMDEEDKNANL